MSQVEELKKESINKKVATDLGWTDVHGGLADGGLYLRGYPPGSNGKGLMQTVPNYLGMEVKGYFITNESDRPFEEHVTKKNEDGSLNYVHPRLSRIPTFHNMWFPNATPVADFGVLLMEINGNLVGVVVGPSIVTYKYGRSEGKLRQWQGQKFFSFPLPKPRSEDGGLRWHKLTEIKAGGISTEVMGATCIDGIGVIACWTRQQDDEWEVTVIDTEIGTWGSRDDIEGDEIPSSPPAIWDDLN
jgi:hypothetical protein